jgi:hypothetical protein
MHELAKAAEGLASVASDMQSVVSKFRIDKLCTSASSTSTTTTADDLDFDDSVEANDMFASFDNVFV